MNSSLFATYGASDRLLFSENDYRNPASSKVISALQDLMCDKNFCTLYSLFMLALARKELSECSFRLFIGEKPNITFVMDEDLSTKPTEEELKEAFIDEWGVKYSKDGRKLLKVPKELSGAYSIKEGTRIICDKAFSFCGSLSKIIIPSSVTSIGDNAFMGCRSLLDIVIPSSVTSIGDDAFFACSSLSKIVIPSSVTSIGDDAFAGCHSLSKIVIPSSVTSIGDDAFAGCHSLSKIVIPSSVTSIGDRAFNNCSSLKYISIPKSVICLNGNPFADWDGKLECLSPNFIYEDDVLFNKDKSKIISFRNQNVESYVIPNSVTSIGDSAFWGCRSLSDIVIPSSVTSIGDSAFWDCSSLSKIVIPSSVTSIGDCAFDNCKIPDNLRLELFPRFGNRIF